FPPVPSPDGPGCGAVRPLLLARPRPPFRCGLGLALAHEFGAQDEALDRVVLAVDLFRIVGQADRLDERALLQRLASTLDLEVLDQDNRVAIGQNVAEG